MTFIHVNISFIPSENPLNTNETLLEMSLSAMKFRSNYHRVPLKQIAAKYHCRANNRTREILLKNRSKQNFGNYRPIFANFTELRLHYFCTILYVG